MSLGARPSIRRLPSPSAEQPVRNRPTVTPARILSCAMDRTPRGALLKDSTAGWEFIEGIGRDQSMLYTPLDSRLKAQPLGEMLEHDCEVRLQIRQRIPRTESKDCGRVAGIVRPLCNRVFVEDLATLNITSRKNGNA